MVTIIDTLNKLDYAIRAADDMTVSMLERYDAVLEAMEGGWADRRLHSRGEFSLVDRAQIDGKIDALSEKREALIVPLSTIEVPAFLTKLARKVDEYVYNKDTPVENIPVAIDTAIADLFRLQIQMQEQANRTEGSRALCDVHYRNNIMKAIESIGKAINELQSKKINGTQLATLPASLKKLNDDLDQGCVA